MRATSGILLLALLQEACSCGRERPSDPEVVLVIDGIEVRRAEWDEYLPFYRSLEPERGEQTTRQRLLDHILRLKLAKRWHGEALEAALTKAQQVAKICKDEGTPALERYGGKPLPEPMTAGKLPPAMARPAFTLEEGRVSDAILLPEGATVIGVLEKMPGPSAPADRVKIVTVDFFVPAAGEVKGKLGAAVRALKGKITYVAEGFEDAVPAFLKSDAP